MRTGFRTMQWRRNDGFRAPQGPIDNSPAPLAPGDVGRSRRVPEGRLKFSRTLFSAEIKAAKSKRLRAAAASETHIAVAGENAAHRSITATQSPAGMRSRSGGITM